MRCCYWGVAKLQTANWHHTGDNGSPRSTEVLQLPLPEVFEIATLSSCLFKPHPSPDYSACSDWSAHTSLSQLHSPCLRSPLLCFELPVSFTFTVNIGINNANVWHGDIVWCHKVTGLKAGLLTKPFRNTVFCWRLAQTFFFYLSRPSAYTRTNNTTCSRKGKKTNLILNNACYNHWLKHLRRRERKTCHWCSSRGGRWRWWRGSQWRRGSTWRWRRVLSAGPRTLSPPPRLS